MFKSRGAIPFNIHTPLCTRSIKLEPLRKKDQSADTNPPQKLRNFCLTPQKKCKDQRMSMHTTPQKRLFQTPSEILVHRGGGGYIKWNGPSLKVFPNIEINECFKTEYGYYFRLELVNVNQSKYTT